MTRPEVGTESSMVNQLNNGLNYVSPQKRTSSKPTNPKSQYYEVGGNVYSYGTDGRRQGITVNNPDYNADPKIEKLGAGRNIKKLKSNLRYPIASINLDQDHIKFDIIKYERQKAKGIEYTSGDEVKVFEMNKDGTDYIEKGTTIINVRNRTDFNNPFVGGARNPTAENRLGSIILPIPGQVSDTNATNFGESNLNNFYAAAIGAALKGVSAGSPEELAASLAGSTINATEILKDKDVRSAINLFFASQAVSSVGANINTNQLFARATGSIINPNMELLFNGPTLRQFNFEFKFTPRYQKEALVVKDIMRAFKQNMSPISSTGDKFMITPNIFKLSYIGRGSKYLNRFKLCALTNMNINYTGEGNYATYADGAPVSSIMQLAFQELSPVYYSDYDTKDGRIGVGY